MDLIRENILPFIQRYLVERESAGMGKATALFPNARSKDGFYSDAGFRCIKSKVEKLPGVKFKLKDFHSNADVHARQRGQKQALRNVGSIET